MKKTVIWFGMLFLTILVIALWLTNAWELPDMLSFGGGDGMLGEALIKSITESGPVGNLEIRRLGAPDVSSVVDTPFLDWLYVIQVWLISFFVSNPGKITVIFYVITFLTSALTMFFLLKKLHCKNSVSFLFAILFSCSTYHIYRNMGHMTLSNYFMVPIAVYLAFYIAGDGEEAVVEGLFKKNGLANLITLYAMAFLLGFTNIYFAAFGLIAMASAVIYRMFRAGKIRGHLKYLGYLAATGGGVFLALLPKIIYGIQNGENPIAASRNFRDAETYGLKLIQLLLPPQFSRIYGAAGITESYQSQAPLISENYMSSLGLIGAVGFLGLCIYFLYSYASKKRNRVCDFASFCVLIMFLFATVGGVGALFNFFITSEIRCYCRISIYIICFCYLALAYMLSSAKIKRPVQTVILAALAVIAYFDQLPAVSFNSWAGPEQTAKVYNSFYSEVEAALEPGDMVYQLPFVSFPEPGASVINEMDAYAPLSAYVYSDSIRWSHGGIKGRNKTAEALYVDDGMGEAFISGIKGAGFKGVCIHADGYSAEERESVLSYYSTQLGIQPIVSEDGRLYFYQLAE